MSVQIKGSGTIGGLDEGLVVSGIVTSSTQLNIGSNIKFGSAGIATASNFKTGSSNLHSTGLTVGNNFLHTTGINVGTGATIHVPATNTLTFGTANLERLRIDSSGRLLLGTTTEGAGAADRLTIASSATAGMTIRSGTSNQGNIYFSDGTSGLDEYRGIVRYDHSDNSMSFRTDATERLRIGSAGQIGIAGANYGTSGQALVSQGSGSSVAWQTITGTTINNNADNRLITGSGTANTLEGESDLTFDGTNLTIPENIRHTGDSNTSIRFPANDTISMEVAGSEIFKITPDAAHGSSQSIQLRTTHTIDGAAVNMGGTKAYSAGIIRGMANIRDGNAYTVTDNGGGIGFSAVFNSGGSHTTMSQIEGVKANNTDGNYEGAIKFATRHHLGNMIEKVRIGQEGLSFQGDTAAANCLSDYEEGTFTPKLRTIGSSQGEQLGTGRYTKTGNMVHLDVQFDNKNATGLQDNNYIYITNLPYVCNSRATSTSPQTYNVNGHSSNQVYFMTDVGATALIGFRTVWNSTWQYWASGHFRGGQIYVRVNITYQTNS